MGSKLRISTGLAVLLSSASTGCSDELADPGPTLSSEHASVHIGLAPFSLQIRDAEGDLVLRTRTGSSGAYGGLAATKDEPVYVAQPVPGWDGYVAGELGWRNATRAHVVEETDASATLEVEGDGLLMHVKVELEDARVRFSVEATGSDIDKTTLGFVSAEDEHFFGMGERFGTVDHRGFSLYSYAEEGALGKGEDTPIGEKNPFPNGPSMTYFPVPFFLSSHGYAVHLDTTYRSEIAFGNERQDAWRFAVNADHFAANVYVNEDPLASIDQYTADTGRPPVPAPWVFGVRRRVGVNAVVDGVPEWKKMRDADIAVTGIDDAVHFLPALSQLGREEELAEWTQTLHQNGYKALAYNNPYVAANDPNAAADYAHGVAQGYFVRKPDGNPALTQFISGKMLTVAAVDLTNPAAVAWYQGVLQRTLDLGYDGWMHDFGEYTPRDAVFYDGRRGDEMHNEYPVLSAKAAYELMEKERPGDYLFFVRSGGSGTQKYVPAVWGGDAEASFDESQGLPSTVRGGLNLSMSGVPYWGSDMTGFKCLTQAPHDKENFLRWVELGAVSPIMMEQNACKTLFETKEKWSLWKDVETIEHYAKYARLHTRLLPYFELLAKAASETGRPLTLHPFLLHPGADAAWAVDDAYYLGPALYAAPVVRRGQTVKKTWLPPGRFLHFEDFTAYEGDREVTIPAPLGKLPLLLVADQLLPLLDPAIDTLAPASDPTVITPKEVADRLDVIVTLTPGGHAKLELADGTVLEATRLGSDAGNPLPLAELASEAIAECSMCFVREDKGDAARIQVNSGLSVGSDLTVADVRLVVQGGPERRVRWDVRRLK